MPYSGDLMPKGLGGRGVGVAVGGVGVSVAGWLVGVAVGAGVSVAG
jgi:hypothetical protein